MGKMEDQGTIMKTLYAGQRSVGFKREPMNNFRHWSDTSDFHCRKHLHQEMFTSKWCREILPHPKWLIPIESHQHAKNISGDGRSRKERQITGLKTLSKTLGKDNMHPHHSINTFQICGNLGLRYTQRREILRDGLKKSNRFNSDLFFCSLFYRSVSSSTT